LQSDVKVSGTTYEEAKRVYDRILREKTGKGYQIAQASANGNEAIAVGLPATKEHSGHTPELLTPIEEPEALLLAQNAAWWTFRQVARQRTTRVRRSQFKLEGKLDRAGSANLVERAEADIRAGAQTTRQRLRRLGASSRSWRQRPDPRRHPWVETRDHRIVAPQKSQNSAPILGLLQFLVTV